MMVGTDTWRVARWTSPYRRNVTSHLKARDHLAKTPHSGEIMDPLQVPKSDRPQRYGEKKSKSNFDRVSVGSPPVPSLDVCVLNIDHCDCVCVHHFDLIQSHPSSIEQKTVKF